MKKYEATVVGRKDFTDPANDQKNYSVLHCISEPIWSNGFTGNQCFTSYVDYQSYDVGDRVEFIYHKGEYIIF